MQKIRVLAVFVFVWICFLGILGWGRVEAAPISQAEKARPAAAAVASGPPQRSTAFDLASVITYTADLRFNRNAAMTIEAWVHPEAVFDDPPGCQTFVEHQLGTSYW